MGVLISRRSPFSFFKFYSVTVFSRGHATLHLAVSVGQSVGRSVCPSVRHIFEFRAVFALLLLPNRPRLDCRVSGLVSSVRDRLSLTSRLSLLSCVICECESWSIILAYNLLGIFQNGTSVNSVVGSWSEIICCCLR